MLFDMHCHLDLMPNMKTIIQESLNEDVEIMAVTTTPRAYRQEINLCKSNSHIKVALGLHPQLVKERADEFPIILQNIQDTKYIGEIGLDFNTQYYASKDLQIEIFSDTIKTCKKLGNKVISIHSVRSAAYVLDILESSYATDNNCCILHWFTGSEKQLMKAIEMGCYFSINLRMLNTENGKKIVKAIPENKLLVETDAPFIREIQHCHEICEEIGKTIITISNLMNRDLYKVIQENSHYVIYDKRKC